MVQVGALVAGSGTDALTLSGTLSHPVTYARQDGHVPTPREIRATGAPLRRLRKGSPAGVAGPSYVEDNARELERMRSIIERLSDDELCQPVNASWTVAGVLGHVAYWDGRALFLANKLTRGVPFTASDHDPEGVDWINDAARPLLLAIPVRRAADLALEIARETDAAVARLAPDQGGPDLAG